MKPSVKIVIYVVLLTAGILFAHHFLVSMNELDAVGKAIASKPDSELTGLNGTGKDSHSVMTYLALFCLTAIIFGFFFAHELSNFIASRTLKLLHLDETSGIRDTEYEKADEAWRNGNHIEAIQLLREYVRNHPREIHALVRIAEIYDKDLKNYPAAALEYEKVIEYPFSPDRWGWLAIRLANIYTGELGEKDKALALLRRIVADYGQTRAAEKARQRLALYEEAGSQAREKERVMDVFSKLVSPDVVDELLGTAELNFGGERKRLSIMFADIRGFTSMTDETRADALAYIAEHALNEEQAKAHMDQTARETLTTVNIYLSTIADKVKEHGGTLDKYMGDCVMAFWGAPAPNEQHALYAVLAAIHAQQALHELNAKREEENRRREADNENRTRQGLPPMPALPILSLGTGLNTGEVIVGLMGSEAHILNYTVFGREVNVAARLEGISGSGRIIIGQGTYEDLLHSAPDLAAKCTALEPVTIKGIKEPVPIYNVPWEGLEFETDSTS